MDIIVQENGVGKLAVQLEITKKASAILKSGRERGQVSARLVGKTWLINTTAAWQRWGVSRPPRGRRPRP